MAYKLIVTQKAHQDLDDALGYIARKLEIISWFFAPWSRSRWSMCFAFSTGDRTIQNSYDDSHWGRFWIWHVSNL